MVSQAKNSTNGNNIFANPAIGAMTQDDVLKHIESVQKKTATIVDNYRRRSRRDFAVFMLEARTTMKTLQESVEDAKLAAVFTRHQILAALGNTSAYTPLIKLIFGKPNAKGEKVTFLGEEHVKWEPDASFARYFNFYEVIDREFAGQEGKELLDWVIERGGPAKIVEDELARKRGLDKVANTPKPETLVEQRDVYLAETRTVPVDMPFTLPEDAGEFMGAVIQKTPDGLYRLVGISKKDAIADFRKLARDAYPDLKKAAEKRETEAAQARAIEEAEARGRDQAAETLAAKMGMTVEQMREHLAGMAEKAAGTVGAAQADDAQG